MSLRMLLPVAAALAAGALASPALATSSGAEGRLAYLSSEAAQPGRAALFIANPDGSDRRLVSSAGGATQWSADGQTLAWYDSGTGSIHVARGDGSDARALSNRVNADFALSPDGKTLVAQRVLRRRKGQTRNWIRDDLLKIDVATGRERLLAYDGEDPAFSPDGRTIAFVDLRFQARGDRYRAINLIRSDGKRRRTIYDGGSGTDTTSLDWSPDGRSIAFTQWFSPPNQVRLRVLSLRTRRVRTLVGGIGPWIVWSPAGNRLLASTWDNRSNYDLNSVAASGGALKPMGWQGMAVAWQPLR